MHDSGAGRACEGRGRRVEPGATGACARRSASATTVERRHRTASLEPSGPLPPRTSATPPSRLPLEAASGSTKRTSRPAGASTCVLTTKRASAPRTPSPPARPRPTETFAPAPAALPKSSSVVEEAATHPGEGCEPAAPYPSSRRATKRAAASVRRFSSTADRIASRPAARADRSWPRSSEPVASPPPRRRPLTTVGIGARATTSERPRSTSAYRGSATLLPLQA